MCESSAVSTGKALVGARRGRGARHIEDKFWAQFALVRESCVVMLVCYFALCCAPTAVHVVSAQTNCVAADGHSCESSSMVLVVLIISSTNGVMYQCLLHFLAPLYCSPNCDKVCYLRCISPCFLWISCSAVCAWITGVICFAVVTPSEGQAGWQHMPS